MVKFTAKVLLLISTLLFGILLGIQQAEHGILSITGIQSGIPQEQEASSERETSTNESGKQGEHNSTRNVAQEENDVQEAYEAEAAEEAKLDKQSQDDVYYIKIDDDDVEMAVVGQEIHIEEKEEKWKELNRQKYSHIGHKIGDVVYASVDKGANSFVRLLDRIF